ncbi:MAG: hypothetical protein GAS50_03035 [Desulfobacterales bacterium]|nr:hypothetical protein [Desulfobacterales bacterium]
MINRFTTIIILAIHAGLGMLMAAFIFEMYYYFNVMVLLAIMIPALFFWLRRHVKGALNGKPKSQKIFQKIFPRNYKPKTALRTMNIGFSILIIISVIALIDTL